MHENSVPEAAGTIDRRKGICSQRFYRQLLYRSGCDIVFAECNDAYAQRLDRAGRYYVNVMGNPAESEWIEGCRCYGFADMEKIADALYEADIAFTSVIGKNLESLGETAEHPFHRISGSVRELSAAEGVYL